MQKRRFAVVAVALMGAATLNGLVASPVFASRTTPAVETAGTWALTYTFTGLAPGTDSLTFATKGHTFTDTTVAQGGTWTSQSHGKSLTFTFTAGCHNTYTGLYRRKLAEYKGKISSTCGTTGTWFMTHT
jgi:hypothetical protein